MAETMAFGGWVVEPIVIVDGKLPQKLATGFGQAFQGISGAGYKPLVYCGHQLVAGTNHMFICEQKLIINPIQTHVVKVVLHEALPKDGQVVGDFSVLSIETIV